MGDALVLSRFFKRSGPFRSPFSHSLDHEPPLGGFGLGIRCAPESRRRPEIQLVPEIADCVERLSGESKSHL